MNRRTWLRALGACFLLRKAGVPVLALDAPPAQAATFAASEISALTAIAEVVLPTALTADDRRLVVRAFSSWFANYTPGADMGHGYGSSTLRASSGPSPISRYPAQFAALDQAATVRGAKTFAALPIAARRELVESALNTPQPVNRLPASPTGANLVADLMGSYFNSQDGWNLCYRAEINRDSCRTLDDSSSAPKPIRG